MFSLAVTEGWSGCQGVQKIEFIDIKRAFFHATARREVYVDLPEEDAEEGMCALLVKSLYGTRDAPQNWEVAYSDYLVQIGFRKGKSSPCIFIIAFQK